MHVITIFQIAQLVTSLGDLLIEGHTYRSERTHPSASNYWRATELDREHFARDNIIHLTMDVPDQKGCLKTLY